MSRQEIQVVVESEWWQVVLGGVIGSVIGGLLTLIGVVLVIRHERRVRLEEVLSSSMAQVMSSTGRILLQARVEPDREYSKQEAAELMDKYIVALDSAFTYSSMLEPKLYELLSAATGDDPNESGANMKMARLYYVAKTWLNDPSLIRRGRVGIEMTREVAQDAFKLDKQPD